MFRGPQILTWSCPKRSLLLLRESHRSAFDEHTGAVGQGARHVKGRSYEEIHGRGRSKEESSLSTKTVSCSTQLSLFCLQCDNHTLKKASFQNLLSKVILSTPYQPLQISVSEKAKQVPNPWKCTSGENVGQNSKVRSTYSNCLTNTSFIEPWRRPWDFCQPLLSFISKTQRNLLQNHLCYRQHSVRPFSLSTHAPWILNHFHRSLQSSSFSPQQIRTIHQAAPPVVDDWRDCLSLENENRCRQRLVPNLKLYEVRKGASQSQGKSQGRWASILVSLCSVKGEPVFLFTLRSRTLKGRHKGDVRLVAG